MKTLSYTDRIRQKIEKNLQPIALEIKDDSSRHAGHAGNSGEGETHFSILIASDHFENLNQVSRHRLVYDTVADEMRERVHALALKTLSSSEYLLYRQKKP